MDENAMDERRQPTYRSASTRQRLCELLGWLGWQIVDVNERLTIILEMVFGHPVAGQK